MRKALESIRAAVTWLNAEPGRKRGIAAGLLGLATVMTQLGHAEWAQALVGLNDVIQNYVVPGMDVAGLIMACWGWIHALERGPNANTKLDHEVKL